MKPQQIFETAMIDYNEKRYHEAKLKLLHLIEVNFKVPVCCYYVGVIEAKSNNLERALDLFLKSSQLDQKNYQSVYFAGEMYEKLGRENSALVQYCKTLELKPDHENAKKGQERISKKVIMQSSPEKSDNKIPAKNYDSISNDPALYKGDLYDQLRQANDTYSKDAVRTIQDIKIENKRPYMRAFMRMFLFIIIFLPIILAAFFNLILNILDFFYRTGRYSYNRPEWLESINHSIGLLIFPCTILPLGILLYKIAQMRSKRISIDRGFITITEGVFTSRTKLYPIHLVTAYEVVQDIFNKGTSHGSLKFIEPQSANTQVGNKITIRGLAYYDELLLLAEKLRSLHFQLRSTNAIRSGIFG